MYQRICKSLSAIFGCLNGTLFYGFVGLLIGGITGVVLGLCIIVAIENLLIGIYVGVGSGLTGLCIGVIIGFFMDSVIFLYKFFNRYVSNDALNLTA